MADWRLHDIAPMPIGWGCRCGPAIAALHGDVVTMRRLDDSNHRMASASSLGCRVQVRAQIHLCPQHILERANPPQGGDAKPWAQEHFTGSLGSPGCRRAEQTDLSSWTAAIGWFIVQLSIRALGRRVSPVKPLFSCMSWERSRGGRRLLELHIHRASSPGRVLGVPIEIETGPTFVVGSSSSLFPSPPTRSAKP